MMNSSIELFIFHKKNSNYYIRVNKLENYAFLVCELLHIYEI